MEKQYHVTAYVKRKGRRDRISIPLSLERAQTLKIKQEAEIAKSIPKYQWCEDIKIEKLEGV